MVAGETTLGAVGQLHPAVAEALDLPSETYLFELDAQSLLEGSTKARRYQPPSRFPALTRDLNVVVARDLPAEQVRAVIARETGELARSIRLFDVYTGPSLPEDHVSLAFSLELSARDRTLTDGRRCGVSVGGLSGRAKLPECKLAYIITRAVALLWGVG